MKRIITFVITLLVLIGLNAGFASITHTNFIDYAFIVGIIVTTLLWMSDAKGRGGYDIWKENLNEERHEIIKLDYEEKKSGSIYRVAFYTSITYSVVMLAISIYHYRAYF